ncbi:PEP-CTERM sorting domain-containing protein [Catenovulum agarivorans]|uniref:PEP-CTERM sorting domain-containing protein n=1 Tax=Catenovulum agarivorans TaxID=1172192 RepID=UPI0002DC4318|nr:PEP-CTERM sorting domain-containing protein [Catenovulum agarivorans]
MKVLNKRIGACAPLVLAASLFWHQSASAGLINNDFANEFDHWNGEVVSYNYLADMDNVASGDITASYVDNFSTSAGSATLTTSFDDENDYWSVVLFQDFTFDIIAPSNSLTLSLDVSYSLTDDFFDYAFVELLDLDDNLAAIDLTSGGAFDVTDWSGVNASIQFGVIDGDFDVFDSITISNLTITETTTDVPEPTSVALLLSGLLLLARQRWLGKTATSANNHTHNKVGV